MKNRIGPICWVILCTTMVGGVSLGAGEQATAKKTASVEGITEYELPNGLRLLLFPDKSQSKVTVNMTVLVGSRHEGYGETGMAHLLEHMVFKGTPTHTNIPKALQDHGAQFNGSTSDDRTNYFETLPASDENLEFAIRLEADRLVNCPIRREDLDSEMTVVRNEFESGENSPTGVLGKRIAAAAFEWHNYGKSTIGNRSDIERVPVDNLRAFYHKYYQPDNVVLVVAGRFDESTALRLVEKYFGAIPRPGRNLDRTYTEEPPQDGERLVTLRRVGSVAAVGIAYHIPAGAHVESAALQVLANILSTQPSGRLYRALVETKLASSVFVSGRGQFDPSLFTIQATVGDPQNLDKVRDTIILTVEQIGAGGVSGEEVTRARQQILKARELSAADTNSIAVSLSEWAAQGDWRLYFLFRDRVEQVTPAEVQAVAQRYLTRNNRTVGMFIPTDKPERIAIPSAPEIKTLVADYKGRAAMAEGEEFDATPANIESRVQREMLAEGIKVTLLPKKSRGQEVHLVLNLRYGNDENLRDYETAAAFLGELMLRGTQKLTLQQLRDELDRLKATLSSGAGGGGRGGRGRGGPPTSGSLGVASFSIHAKRDTLPAVLKLLQQVLREPTLSADQFEILRRERTSFLEQSRTEPTALAARLLQQKLAPFPRDDVRYVPSIEESVDRMKSVTRDQVVQLYREFVGSRAGELSIVGDFDPYDCLPILKETLAGWTASRPYARIAMPATKDLAGSQETILTPDKANATYVSGLEFALRDDNPDYPALLIANYIYGAGSLASRLGTRVRQQEGLSYGVGSSFSASPFDARATLLTNAICNPQNIGKVRNAIGEELARLVRDGVTPKELEEAKRGYLQAQAVARSLDASLAGLLANASYAGRTLNFQAELDSKIAALTPEQVLEAIRKYIDPTKVVIVTAGDFGPDAEE